MVSAGTSFNPFPGLRSFETEESYLFFGREAQVEELLQKLQEHRFIAVFGVSGSGKSSLVKAGLLPELYGGGMVGAGSRWRVAVVRPGNAPINTLANVLNKHDVLGNELGEYSTSKQFSILFTETMLRRGRLGLIEAVEYAELPTDVNLLVVIDQFEEIFRYTVTHKDTNAADESAAFVKLLLEAIKREQPPIYILLTMRSDYLGECSQFEGLAEEINKSHYLVPRMTRDQLREAILSPIAVTSARVGGANITTQLLNRLLNDVGDDPDQLPILQHALMRTWNNWMQDESTSHDKSIDLKHYINIGSMREALSQHGDEIYNELSPHQKKITETLFKCLTTKEDGRYIRRLTKLERICDIAKASEEDVIQIVDQFRSEGRSFLMPYTGEINSKDVIDISHESLIRVWQKLKDWSDEEAEKAEDYHRLVEAWKLKEREKGDLLSDNLRLAAALDWRDKYNPNEAWAAMYADKLGDATDFKAVMQFLKDSDEKKKRQQYIKIWLALAWTALTTFVSIILFILWREAKKGQLNAFSSSSKAYFASNQQLKALVESIKAGKELKQFDLVDQETTQRVLVTLRKMVYSVRERNILEGNQGEIHAVAISADGKTLATAGQDGTIKFWEPNGKEVLSTIKHKSAVRSVSFSPNNKLIVSGNEDGSVILWKRNGEQIKYLGHHERNRDVLRVAFSPDSQTVASASTDKTVKIWDIRGNLRQILRHNGEVNSVQFSPDGKTIVTAVADGTIHLWILNENKVDLFKRYKSFEVSDQQVEDVSFSPDGKIIASVSADGNIKLWDTEGKLIDQVEKHDNTAVYSVKFSPDGKRILTAGDDAQIKLWNIENLEKPIHTFQGHTDKVNSVFFSPDGQTIASASGDETVRLWSSNGEEPLIILQKQGQEVTKVNFSPDGKIIAWAGYDKTIKIWNRSEKKLTTLNGHTNKINSIIFSPDSKTLISASEDKTIRLWNLDGNYPKIFKNNEGAVYSLSFSPDGKTFASGDDKTIKLWNLQGDVKATFHQPNQAAVKNIIFSPDGTTIASGSDDSKIKLWNLQGDIKAVFYKPNQAPITSVSFSPDGTTIASGSNDGKIKLWSFDGKSFPFPEKHGDSAVLAVSFNPNNQMLASGSADTTIKLWTLKGNMQNDFQGNNGNVFSVDFSPDGKILASSDSEGGVILWNLALEDLLASGCNEVQNYLKTSKQSADDYNLCDNF